MYETIGYEATHNKWRNNEPIVLKLGKMVVESWIQGRNQLKTRNIFHYSSYHRSKNDKSYCFDSNSNNKRYYELWTNFRRVFNPELPFRCLMTIWADSMAFAWILINLREFLKSTGIQITIVWIFFQVLVTVFGTFSFKN